MEPLFQYKDPAAIRREIIRQVASMKLNGSEFLNTPINELLATYRDALVTLNKVELALQSRYTQYLQEKTRNTPPTHSHTIRVEGLRKPKKMTKKERAEREKRELLALMQEFINQQKRQLQAEQEN